MLAVCTRQPDPNETIALIKNFLSRIVSDKDLRRGGDFVAAQVAYDNVVALEVLVKRVKEKGTLGVSEEVGTMMK